MGIIQRQAILGTVYIYIGVVIGFITTGILFPRILETDQIGLLGILVSYSVIIAQFASLGLTAMITRMFPYFRSDDKRHHGFVFFLFGTATIGLLLALIVFIVFIRPGLGSAGQEESNLLSSYADFIIPLTIAYLYFNILDHYYKVLHNAVAGTLLRELVQRVLILIIIIIYWFDILTFPQFVVAYTGCIIIPTIILFFTILSTGQLIFKPDFKMFNRHMVKTLAGVSFFGIISSATGVITINIDRVMIEHYLGLDPTGIYTIAFFFGTLVVLPSRPLSKVAGPFVANAWKKGDKVELKMLIQKSSLYQMIIGVLILIGIWANIDNVFEILPKEYLPGKYVILLIGLAYLLDMSIGVAHSVITNSKYYYMGAAFNVMLVILVIVTNILFIPEYGIIGAALASALSKLITNTLRFLYIWMKFGLQPYNYKYLLVLLTGGFSYSCGYFLPGMSNFILDIIIRSILIITVFVSLILLFKISEEINNRFRNLFNSIFHKKE